MNSHRRLNYAKVYEEKPNRETSYPDLKFYGKL